MRMGSANVNFPAPLTRLNPWYPGQFGVPGTDHETGLRMHSTGAVFWVDPNYPGVSDLRDGTNPTNPLESVEAALALCQAYRGDVIAVMANNYWDTGSAADGYTTPISEAVTVTVPGVRIVGVFPSSPLGVAWEPPTADGTCITIDNLDVTVEGFCFMGNAGGTGVSVRWDSDNDRYGDRVVIRHNYFEEVLDEGIVLDYVYYADIHDNWFDDLDEYGIYNSAVTGDPAYLQIHHNWFYDVDTGAIWLPGVDRCHIYENSIYELSAAQQAGAPTNRMINLTNGSRNQVHHNTLSCILPAAAAWDYNACNTAGANDAWMQNYCLNGPTTTNPA